MGELTLERAIIFHDFAHVGIDVARRDEDFVADYFLLFEVHGIEHNGQVGLLRDVVKSALPGVGERAGAFGCDGQFESIALQGTLCQLVGQAGLATTLYGHATDGTEKFAQGPKEPFLFHQETCSAAYAGVVELGNDKIPVAGVGRYADDALVIVGHADVYGPAHHAVEDIV